MAQQPVMWGDTVFICFPNTDDGPKITNDVGSSDDGYTRPTAGSGTILNGDPYRITRPPSLPTPSTPVQNKSTIRLYRINDSSQPCWYNGSGDQWIEMRSRVSNNDSRADWIIEGVNIGTDNVIYYGQQFRLINSAQQPYTVTFRTNPSGGRPGFANISVGGPDTSNNSIIMLLQGPLDNAKLQCCRDNPAYTQPDYCGNFRGTTCSGQCDTILTDYCARVTTTDPKCGCLLPPSFYLKNRAVGPPECIDDRCVNQNTYKKSTQCKPNCNIINCVIDAKDIAGTNIDKVIFDQKCSGKNGPSPSPGPPGPPGPNNGPNNGPPSSGSTSNIERYIWIILAVIIAIIIISLIIFLIYRSMKK
nr:virion associated membrane protein [Mimivirus sp.]